MNGEPLVLAGAVLALVSGVPGLLFGRVSRIGERLAALILVLGCSCGLYGVAVAIQRSAASHGFELLTFESPLPGVKFSFGVDPLSAVFLVPVFLIPLLGSIYGLAYWKQPEHAENGRKLRLFFGALAGALALVVFARDWITFLFGWELMAVSAFFLVATEDHLEDVKNAGWLYLASSHTATLSLFCLFALIASLTGTFSFQTLPPLTTGVTVAIFLLAFCGFGLKAGVMPLHFWLPSAHAMAPSHVSALMSGVLIKIGIYGLFRLTSLIETPPAWWGATLLTLGTASGVLGMAFAAGQRDLKRLLAYSSIENIGIICMGLGLGLLGRTHGQPLWIVLGMGGALLHVWNHAAYKAILFFGSGALVHATHTRQMDQMGGLAKLMPKTAFCFLIASAANCGLPPLNGFVSEFLIYLGLFRTLGLGIQESTPMMEVAIAAPALAMIGAMAVVCFVKAYGTVFLGTPRTDCVKHAHESEFPILLAMGVLVVCCFGIGLGASSVAPIIDRAVLVVGPDPEMATAKISVTSVVPWNWIIAMNVVLLALLGGGVAVLAQRVRAGGLERSGTWGCGFRAATPRIQYTSSSFTETLVGLFAWVLRPREMLPRIKDLFPQHASYQSDVPDVVLENAVGPASHYLSRVFSWLRYFQQGSVQAYLLYILATLVVLLLWR